jgi:hypothetical protein
MKKLVIVISVIVVLIVVGAIAFFLMQEKGEEVSKIPEPPSTEIRIKGSGTEMVISPSKDREIKGIVTLTMEKVPEGTKSVAFATQGPGQITQDTPINILGFDRDGSDGWSMDFDTYSLADGTYTMNGFAFSVENPGEGVDEVGVARVQVIINNSA